MTASPPIWTAPSFLEAVASGKVGTYGSRKQHPPELRERAVAMVFELRAASAARVARWPVTCPMRRTAKVHNGDSRALPKPRSTAHSRGPALMPLCVYGREMGVATLPLTGSAACPMSLVRRAGFVWPSGRAGAVTWFGAGQAAAAGGPQAAANRVSHSCSRCQPSGRCRVMWPRPCRAVRAATSIRSRRMVAPRALA